MKQCRVSLGLFACWILLLGCTGNRTPGSASDVTASKNDTTHPKPLNVKSFSKSGSFLPAQAFVNAETALVQAAVEDYKVSQKMPDYRMTLEQLQKHPWIKAAGLDEGKFAMQLESAISGSPASKPEVPSTAGYTKLDANSTDPALSYTVFDMLAQSPAEGLATLKHVLRSDEFVVADMRYTIPKRPNSKPIDKLSAEEVIVQEASIGPNVASILNRQITQAEKLGRKVEILKRYAVDVYGDGKGGVMFVVLDGFKYPHRLSGQNFSIYKESVAQLQEAFEFMKRNGSARLPKPVESIIAVPLSISN